MDNRELIAAESKKRTLKKGGYSLILIVIVIAAAVILNLIVMSLPDKYTKFDLSGSNVYQISDETRAFTDTLNDDITIYFVATDDGRNEQLATFLERYKGLSSHISVVDVDPEENPAYAKEHGITAENSLVVSSYLREETVPYSDIFTYSQETKNEFYSSLYYIYGYNISDLYDPDVFAADSAITSAIDYVTTSNLPTVYMLTGHGESELIPTITGFIEYNNIELSSVSLMTADAMPEDADVVIVNNPTSDLNAGETALLLSFIEGGGKVILVTDSEYFSNESMPNVSSIGKACGLIAYDGIVLEENADYFSKNQYFLVPRLQDCAVTKSISNPGNVTVVMDRAHAIVKDPDNDGSKYLASAIIKTSDSAYVIPQSEDVRARADGDVTGEFWLGAYSHNEIGGALVWYSSSFLNSEESFSYVNYNDLYVFAYSVTEICSKPATISIDAVKMSSSSTLTLTELDVIIWSVIFMAVIPLAFFIPGLIVWIRRRRR